MRIHIGAVAVQRLPPGDSPACAIQRQADTTAIGIDGNEVPALSAPSGQASGTENLENPGASLAAIEEGRSFGSDESVPSPEQEQRALQAAQANAAAGTPKGVTATSVSGRLGAGQALDATLRARMEGALGRDFSRVRVHADPRDGELARALAAHAFTVGEHIVFAPGRYRSATVDGQHLVAHELAHVIQQRRGLGSAILADGIGRPNDAYEREAEATAARLTAGGGAISPPRDALGTVSTSSAAALQLFSGSAAASYAKTWATSTSPRYGSMDDDCTNFVSQAMEAGGWKYAWGFQHRSGAIQDMGICELRKSNTVWWFKRNQCRGFLPWRKVHASHTWGGAENFYQFLKGSGRATLLKAISDLEVGDVLQRDHNDNTIHHTMVVTEKGPASVDGKSIIQLWLSYHSKNTLNRPFWGKGNMLDTTQAGWNYYAWRIT